MTGFTIDCEGVGFRYAIRQGHGLPTYHDALKNVNFSMTTGERLGIMGANGAGKSTLLRLLAGLMYPTSGRIRRSGRATASLLSLAGSWYPDLSGRDNSILACLMAGFNRREAEARWEAIAEFSELGEWLDRPVRTYSTGMQARLSLATAIQARPDVLLLDETLSVGDAGFKKKAAEAVTAVMGDVQSFVLVSHDYNAIATMCDRALWLEGGIVRQDGPVKDVLKGYKAWTESSRNAPRSN